MKTEEKSEVTNDDTATRHNESQTTSNLSHVDVDDYFGGCPHCGLNDGYLNVGPNHWFTCDKHKVRWCGGSNLMGSWRAESESDWKENERDLARFETVMPVFSFAELELRRNTPPCPSRVPVTHTDYSVDVAAACIRYHPALDSDFECWAESCGREPAELRRMTETAVCTHHHAAVIEECHKAHHGRPDTFTLLFEGLTIFYSLQEGCIFIRGYGYEIDGEPMDDFDGGGFYS